MLRWTVLFAVASSLCLVPPRSAVHAVTEQAPPAQEDPAHNELRALKKELTDAVNAKDLDALLALLDENVVVTWQNGEVSHGPEQVRAYYDRMMKGPQRIVDSVTINPTVDELTHLYGNTGVAFGSSIPSARA